MPLPRHKVRSEDLSLRALTPPEHFDDQALTVRSAGPVGPKVGAELRQKKLDPPEHYEDALLAGPAAELQTISSAAISPDLFQMLRSDLREDVQGIVLRQQHALQEELGILKSMLQVHQGYLETLVEIQDPFFSHYQNSKISKLSEKVGKTPAQKDGGELSVNVGREANKDSCATASVDFTTRSTFSSQPPSPTSQPMGDIYESSNDSKIRDARSTFQEELHLHQTHSVITANASMRTRLEHYLKSKEFEIVILFVVIANALLICWECQYQGLQVGCELQYPGRQKRAETVWPGAEEVFACFDWFFGLAFLVEMILKLIVWRCKYFYDSHHVHYHGKVRGWRLTCMRRLLSIQGWNLLDMASVCAFLGDKMAESSAVNPQILRMLRLFRLFRLVRLLRMLETLDYLYVMMTAISGLGRVLFWAVILLTVMLLMCTLFLVQILQATYFHEVSAGDLTPEGLQKHQKMYEYFGTCTRCMLSMFEITLGNWPPIARLLSEEVSQWFILICVLHKLTIGFSVVGVITGIILQETFNVAQMDDIIMFRKKKRASLTLRKKMKILFDTLDAHRDGKINMMEFQEIQKDPEMCLWLASLDIETDDLATLFSLIDEDSSGYITLDELDARMPHIKGAARSIDVLWLMKMMDMSSLRPTLRPALRPALSENMYHT